jgi:hypothetical protein
VQDPSSEVPAGWTLTVIVPVAERPRPLEEIYELFAPTLVAMGRPFEFVFVVSPWGRSLVPPLGRLIAEGAAIRVLEVGSRAGESGMLAAAAAHANGNLLITLPPYMRVRPEAIATLVDRVVSGQVDMATACRSRDGDSWFNQLQNRAFHTLLRGAIGGSFHDVASGVRAFRAELLEEVTLYGDFFRFLPILARTEGWRVEEIVVPQHPEDRRSRVYSIGVYYRRLLDLLGVFFLARFTQKPLRFFGLVGSAFGGVGSVILIVLFIQRMMGQAISARPLLLLGVLLFVVGMQAIAIGLVGEIIVHFGASRTRLYRVRDLTTPHDGGRPSPP